MSKKEFYRQCYLQTGWLPAQPLTQRLAVGDVCQIRAGCFQPLLNISDAHLAEDWALADDIALASHGWSLSQGAYQRCSEMLAEQGEAGERLQRTRQAVEFSHCGDFMFHARALRACMLLNWNQIRDDLTLKLTQLHYSFRRAYVVTGVAIADHWALAVAGQADARLEMSAAIHDCDCYALLGHETAMAESCSGMESYEVSRGRAAHFFKAKKLVMSDAMTDRYLIRVLENRAELGSAEIAAWLHGDLFDQIRANELNLNTSIGLFSWVDLSLDDVERLGD